jgi:hypothetical protein
VCEVVVRVAALCCMKLRTTLFFGCGEGVPAGTIVVGYVQWF